MLSLSSDLKLKRWESKEGQIMSKFTGAFIILTVCVLVCPALSQADIAYIKNEDKIVGTIQSPAFTVQTPYGKVRVETEYLRSIRFEDGSVGRWILETINNDQFSGVLLNNSVQFLQDDGRNRTIARDNIKRIWRAAVQPSQRKTTTIVTMKNNDRFSTTSCLTVKIFKTWPCSMLKDRSSCACLAPLSTGKRICKTEFLKMIT